MVGVKGRPVRGTAGGGGARGGSSAECMMVSASVVVPCSFGGLNVAHNLFD